MRTEWCRGQLHGAAELRNRPGDQPSHYVTHDPPSPHLPVQRRHPASSDDTGDTIRDLSLANISAALKKRCMSAGLSSNNFKCSTVIPDGPSAVPLFADLKFAPNLSRSNVVLIFRNGVT